MLRYADQTGIADILEFGRLCKFSEVRLLSVSRQFSKCNNGFIVGKVYGYAGVLIFNGNSLKLISICLALISVYPIDERRIQANTNILCGKIVVKWQSFIICVVALNFDAKIVR